MTIRPIRLIYCATVMYIAHSYCGWGVVGWMLLVGLDMNIIYKNPEEEEEA